MARQREAAASVENLSKLEHFFSLKHADLPNWTHSGNCNSDALLLAEDESMIVSLLLADVLQSRLESREPIVIEVSLSKVVCVEDKTDKSSFESVLDSLVESVAVSELLALQLII